MSVSSISQNDYSTLRAAEVIEKLQTRNDGLRESEVIKRQKQYGLNLIHKRRINILNILLRQLTGNPLILILASATFISYLLGQHASSYYIFGMILVSILLGFWNEYSAERTVDDLLKKISPLSLAERDGQKKEIPVSQLTIGDIVLLSQGSIIPADLRLIETQDLEINESVLTGEAKTVCKNSQSILPGQDPTAHLANIGFMGTTVESGSGRGVVIKIGKDTEFGKIAKSTTYLKPTTEFQKGLARFGNLIVKVIVILTVCIFGINAFLGHQVLESLLFALAIAVGLTPELLPVIVTVSLSQGAGKLSKKHVVVKRLISIENLGNMDILCTDKTGTLTEGKIELISHLDMDGKQNDTLLTMALFCNSAVKHHKFIGNAIDVAIRNYALKTNFNPAPSIKKISEEPFDYAKKMMYSVISQGKESTLVVKGAPDVIIPLCPKQKNPQEIYKKFSSLNQEGLRIVVIAQKKIQMKETYTWSDLKDLNLAGYLTFLDVPKLSAKEALSQLKNLNVETKVLTGDNELVTQKICRDVGMEIIGERVILGSDLVNLNDEDLSLLVKKTNVFARMIPEQKLRVIQALQRNGHTVGYLGDGINDLPALHNADVGLSVNSAIDVAKEAASVVLLRKGLDVIADGIREGRRTFNNTIKYILMGTSSNFGNMFSAAVSSFFLPFLPMTPVQILLTNGLYDISQLSIPSDNVDHESLLKPRHWNMNFIRNYMIFFGPLSSIYDFLTFGVMLFFFHARGALFQTGWFIESLATEILVVFIIRTARKPFFKSKPSKWLVLTCFLVVGFGVLLPFTPLSKEFGFLSPPPLYFGILIFLVGTYLILVESVKTAFLKRYSL